MTTLFDKPIPNRNDGSKPFFSKNNKNRSVFKKNNGKNKIKFNIDNVEYIKKSEKLKS